MEHKNAHGNPSNSCKRVHYADNNDKEDDIDNYTEGEICSAISEVSKSSAKYTGDSEISVGTSILDGEDQDVKVLRKKLESYEYKIKYLENENKEINSNLINERVRASKLEKKLQFVKDNQEVFMRLKEAYINMKYNEAAGRKMIEIREKSVQTWQGIICSSCTESEELRRQIDVMIQKYKELFVISPGEMEHLVNTVKYLKDLIDRREKSWALNIEREHKLQNHIAILEQENLGLKELLEKRDLNIKEADNLVVDEKLEKVLLEERKIEEMQKFVETVTKDMEKLKKIIIKYEKKFREIKEKYSLTYISPLSDKEGRIVQQIISKHNSKVQMKSTEKLLETKSDLNEKVVSQTHRPSSPLGISRTRDDTGLRLKTPERPKPAKSYERKAESAIMMMDCLFD